MQEHTFQKMYINVEGKKRLKILAKLKLGRALNTMQSDFGYPDGKKKKIQSLKYGLHFRKITPTVVWEAIR